MKVLLIVFSVLILSGCAQVVCDREVLYQTSTIDALLEGVYDGETSFKQLAEHGDLAIGTFNALDGELIGLDGEFYQVKADGKAYPVDSRQKTPFAAVTYFDSDEVIPLEKITTMEGLQQFLDKGLPGKNIFYAIRIDGFFNYVKTRSVPRQKKPYPALVEVVKNQPIFEFSNVKGTIVGFRCPAYVKGINVPGYHFHFITDDRKAGGHLLDCRMNGLKAVIDYTYDFHMVLPENEDFSSVDLTQDKEKELKRVEK